LSFTLVGPGVSRSSASATLHPRTGEYVFNNLPVGNYTITSLGLAANEQLWWSKAVPSAAAGSSQINLSLQPDTFNRALIPIRPNRPGAIDLVVQAQGVVPCIQRHPRHCHYASRR